MLQAILLSSNRRLALPQSPLKLLFSETIQADSGFIHILRSADSSLVASIGPEQMEFLQDTLVITTPIDLAEGQ